MRGGNDEAFEAIVQRYRQPLLRHCSRLVSPAEAEDAVQDALLTAYRTIPRTSADLRLGAWLFRISHNSAIGILRRKVPVGPLAEVTAATESAHDVVLRRERMQSTLTAMSALPEAQRRALVEREFAGRGHREIAARLGRSEAAIRQLLNRARTQLRDRAAALAPLLLRLLPVGGDQPLAGPLAARAGAVALALAAAGGGAAILSRTVDREPPRVVGAGQARPADASISQPGPAGSAETRAAGASRLEARPGGGPTGRRVSQTGATRPAGRTIRQQASVPPPAGSPAVHRGVGGSPAIAPAAGTLQAGGPASSAVPAGPGAGSGAPSEAGSLRSGSSPAESTPADSGQSPEATGQPGSPAAQSGSASGASGAAPGQTGATPGQSGSAPPGQSGSAPGHSGSAPGDHVVGPSCDCVSARTVAASPA